MERNTEGINTLLTLCDENEDEEEEDHDITWRPCYFCCTTTL
jgi:hypothetical protein